MLALPIGRVLIADAVDHTCGEVLRSHRLQVDTKLRLPRQQLLSEIQEYDGLIVRSDTKVDAEVLAAGRKLRAVGRAGTGVDNIDIPSATDAGVLVLNTPGGNSLSACELTCCLIMNLARNVPAACSSLKKGLWERKQWTGEELNGKTLGVVGLGRVGREVASRMGAFGMPILGYDPYPPAEPIPGVTLASLDEIWAGADYITLHVPLTPQTKGLLGAKELKMCKPGVAVVNCSRGGVVDEEALLEAVENGARAALDVFSAEPPDTPLLKKLCAHPRVIVTPHLGASTKEAQVRVAAEIAEQFVGLAHPSSGYRVDGVVNCPGLRELLSDGIGAGLARALGTLGRGLGADTALLEAPPHLTAAALLGLLPPSSNGLNIVSAPAAARKKGLSFDIRPTTGPELVLTITSQQGKHVLKGIVQDDQSLLLAIDDANFTPGARLTANTLVFRASNPQLDLPSLIGELMKQGATLNNMSMAQGKEVSWIVIETDRPPQTLDLKSLPSIISH